MSVARIPTGGDALGEAIRAGTAQEKEKAPDAALGEAEA